MKKSLIPPKYLCKFPYLYKYLFILPHGNSEKFIKELIYCAGNIAAIQNKNSRLETFYKSISRL